TLNLVVYLQEKFFGLREFVVESLGDGVLLHGVDQFDQLEITVIQPPGKLPGVLGRNILMLKCKLPLIVEMHHVGFEDKPQVFVQIQRINDLKRLGSRDFHRKPWLQSLNEPANYVEMVRNGAFFRNNSDLIVKGAARRKSGR